MNNLLQMYNRDVDGIMLFKNPSDNTSTEEISKDDEIFPLDENLNNDGSIPAGRFINKLVKWANSLPK